MKGDTVLDYVELQLTPPRTRCELFVSANGLIEKLASGFLKPFLLHLRAVEEQVARGCNSVRLEHPRFLDDHRRSWFTKGTVERFVRFVSTPEVLERVKSVEDELAQLEQVRSIQASSLCQAENFFMGADSTAAKQVVNIHSGVLEGNGSSKLIQPRRYQIDAAESGAEASKIQLLRAMDSRLLALQQEQSIAFGRAAAAGFGSKNMVDLIAFSEHFGAERLCTACRNFLGVLKTRHAKSSDLDPEAVSSCSGILLCNALTGLDVGPSQGPQADVQDESRHSDDDTNKATSFDSLSSRDSGCMEVRKRRGPPENICSNLYVDQNEADSNSSNGALNGVLVNGSPEFQSSIKETTTDNTEQEMGQKDTLFRSIAMESDISLRFVQCKDAVRVASTDHMTANLKQCSEACVDCDGGSSHLPSSSERRSSLPFREASTKSLLPSNTSISVQEPFDERKNRAVTLSTEDSENHRTPEDVVGPESSSNPVVAPARRLSVQDAISLFENKQRRDSIESLGKYRPSKQESNRASSEGARVCSSGNMTLKRQDSVKSLEACMGLQENQPTSKPEIKICQSDSSVTSNLFGTALLDPTHSLQERHRVSLTQQLSGNPVKTLSTSQLQPSVVSVSPKVESAIGKTSTHHEESVSSDSVTEASEGDWRKQFKLQLERSLSKESFTRDFTFRDDLQNFEPGLSMPKKSFNPVKLDPPKSNNVGLLANPVLGNRSNEAGEKGDCSLEWRQPLPLQNTSGFKTLPVAEGEVNAGQNVLDIRGLCLPDFKKAEPMGMKEEGGRNDNSKLPVLLDNVTDQSNGRESLGSSLVNPLDNDIQTLVTSADHQMKEDDEKPGGVKGRFYEQYRKLRDAKLMEDQDSKRAEREAKLRVMEETLTRRKAEMDARAGRQSKNGFRATKMEALKTDLHTPKKEQQNGGHEDNKSSWKGHAKPMISSTSPPLTPHISKEFVPTSKPQGGRKAGVVVSQKGATPPRISSRPTSSSSPKLAPKSTTAAAAYLRKSVASTTMDNPLARSVPCFANLRKENTKPSPGSPLGSARVHPKSIGLTRGVNEAAPLEANVNVPARTNFLRSGPTKEDQQHRSGPMRKTSTAASDFKTQSASNDDGILAPLKGQREMRTETTVYNKLRWSAVGPLQDTKPFLRKGRGIGPGTGPGLLKQKASSVADLAKTSDERTTISETAEPNNDNGALDGLVGVLNESNSREFSEVENMDMEDDLPVDFGSIDKMEVQAINMENMMREDSETASDMSAAVDTFIAEPSPDNLHNTERACHTISLPIDIETHNRYAVEFGTKTEADSNPLFDSEALGSKEEEIEALPQNEENTKHKKLFENQFDDASMSLCSSSLPHDHDMAVFPSVLPSPPSSNAARYDQSSPLSAVKLESPVGSPASWNSSQLQYADVIQSNKKWVGCQKPITISQPQKDSVRGFKRLLKFGRKSRTSELATADCISASTNSEGDDDSEDQTRFADEVSSRRRPQERRYNDVPGNLNKTDEEGSALNARSSIPTPPANFRLRDDHISGGTMLKAPRSFFSLSSLRSRGCEWKSR